MCMEKENEWKYLEGVLRERGSGTKARRGVGTASATLLSREVMEMREIFSRRIKGRERFIDV